MTGLTFDLIGVPGKHTGYLLLVGVATAALYAVHRVVGIQKVPHAGEYERYTIIRKYKQHIWLYSLVWTGLSVWYFIPFANWKFFLMLLPGGVVAVAYVLPFLRHWRQLRDLGWIKIILIGWSWGWLTAFIPAYYFENIPLHLAIIIGLERALFIIALTIPFDIRDIRIDTSVGLLTMPSRFGMRTTIRTGWALCVAVLFLAFLSSFHFFNTGYFLAMLVACAMTLWIISKSSDVRDDYFFSGLADGVMIIAAVTYMVIG
jgi:4-hydroxybenzoate polyprenyltransferase